jgi:hypothetical protein
MPLGQITLPVTFGTLTNYRTEFIQFEVTDFETSYHALEDQHSPSSWLYLTTHTSFSRCQGLTEYSPSGVT